MQEAVAWIESLSEEGDADEMAIGTFIFSGVEIRIDLLANLVRANLVAFLWLDSMEIASSELVALFDAAMQSGRIHTLSLSVIHSDEMALNALVTLMKQSKSIVSYNLSSLLGDNDAALICDALAGNDVIEELSLAANGIGLEGARAFGSFLKANNNGTLESLNLGSNRFGDEGVFALVDGLRSNESLRKLNLSYCRISNEGAVALASLLSHDSHLVELDVSNNHIGEAGWIALANVLKQNQNLQHLSISGSFGFGKANFESAFIPVFQSNVTLLRLDGIESSSKIEALLLRNKEQIPTAVRRAALLLIGVRQSTDFEGMGDFAVFPKDIVRLIAQTVYATRRDPLWIQALK